MSEDRYRFKVLFWFLIGAYGYNRLLFRPLEMLSGFDSRGIIYTVIGAFAFFGLLINHDRHRSGWSVFTSVVLAFGVCAGITYYAFIRRQIWISVSVGLLLALGYAVFLLTYRVRDTANRRSVLRQRLKQAYFGTRSILACCAACLLAYLCVSTALGLPVLAPSPEPEAGEDKAEMTVAGQMETVALLEEKTWATLDIGERLRVLQTLADIEACALGLPHELTVCADDLREKTTAHYIDAYHRITVDTGHLEEDDAHSVLRSLCHEARHAYQHRLCDLYDSVSPEQRKLLLFGEARMFKDDFADYVDGYTDEAEYYYQACEIDARAYAGEAVVNYFALIAAYQRDRTVG